MQKLKKGLQRNTKKCSKKKWEINQTIWEYTRLYSENID